MAAETVDRFGLLKSQIVLSEYVGKFTNLHKTGQSGRWRGPCPIHEGDNSSAFTVNDKIGAFYCFNCQASGSIVDFWLAKNGRTSPSAADLTEALNTLASEMSVALPESQKNSNEISVSRLADALKAVAAECHDYLLTSNDPEAEDARAYLKGRKVTKREIVEWQLGLLPEPDYAMDLIKSATKDTEALIETHFLARSTRPGASSKLYIPLAGRLLFPIRTSADRVVSFGGRVIEGIKCESKDSKYLNLAASRLYDKSRVLYGMDRLKKTTERAIIVEGYLDVIAITSAGGGVGVAPCGTALTPEQTDLVGEVKEVIELFDADTAGRKALVSSVWVINRLGDRVKATILEDGKDAFELSRKDPEALLDSLEGAEPMLARAVAERYALTTSDDDFDKWVKKVNSELQRMEDSDQLLREAYSLRKVQGGLSNYRRILATMNTRKTINTEGEEKDVPELLDSGMLSLLRRLMQLNDLERDACLTTLAGWSPAVEDAVRSWFPVTTDVDLAAFALLAAGNGKGPRVANVEQALGQAMPEESAGESAETIKFEDISAVLRRMIALMQHDQSSLKIGELDPSLRNSLLTLRRASQQLKDLDKQMEIFVFLADLAVDLQRARTLIDA